MIDPEKWMDIKQPHKTGLSVDSPPDMPLAQPRCKVTSAMNPGPFPRRADNYVGAFLACFTETRFTFLLILFLASTPRVAGSKEPWSWHKRALPLPHDTPRCRGVAGRR